LPGGDRPWRACGAQAKPKGAITSKIKHAMKLKTSPARLAQLLQPTVAFCLSLQPMTALARLVRPPGTVVPDGLTCMFYP